MSDSVNPTLKRMVNRNMSAFWGSFSRNGFMFFLCMVLAFAVWQGIRESNSHEVVLVDVPVLISAGDGLAVQSQSTDVVSVRFRGSLDDVRFISREQVSVQMAISDPTRLRQTLKFSNRHVSAPSRAHAVAFYPPEISVTVDREVERSLPVKATFVDELPEGIQLENAVCEPATVRLRGAERKLLELEQVRTAPISLNERFISFTTHAEVAANGQAWTAEPHRISVTVDLVEHVDTRRMDNLPVRPLVAPEAGRAILILPDRVSVVLRGSPDLLDRLMEKDVVVYVDCSDVTELTDYELPFRVHTPEGIVVEKTEPAVVQVTIQAIQ